MVEERPGEDYGKEVPRRTVKEFDTDDQPRERALKLGVGALSVADLWAIVLRTGTPGKPITELCRDLMRVNDGSLRRLERRDLKELTAMKGIGITKAVQIQAVMELMRRYSAEEAADNPTVTRSADIFAIMRPKIGNLPHEEIWALLMNRRNEVLTLYRVSEGGAAATVFDVKKLLKAALLEGCCSVALCHNHPSGTLRPSPQDDDMTRRCKEACKATDLRLIDHLIITSSSYYSYSDEGRL